MASGSASSGGGRPNLLQRMASRGSFMISESVNYLMGKEHPLVVIVYQGRVQSQRRIDLETKWIRDAVCEASGRVEVYQELDKVVASLDREMEKKRSKKKKSRSLLSRLTKKQTKDDEKKTDIVLHVLGHACATSDADVPRTGRHVQHRREEDAYSLSAGGQGLELKRGTVSVETSMSDFVQSIQKACGNEELYLAFCNASCTADLAGQLPATKTFGWQSTCVDQGAALFARNFYRALVGMEVDQAFKAATESLYRTPFGGDKTKCASLLLRDPDERLTINAASLCDAGEGATLMEAISPSASDGLHFYSPPNPTTSSLNSFGANERDYAVLEDFWFEGDSARLIFECDHMSIGLPSLRPPYSGEPMEPPPAKRHRSTEDVEDAEESKEESVAVPLPPYRGAIENATAITHQVTPSPPSSESPEYSSDHSVSDGTSTASTSFVEQRTHTVIGRQLVGIGRMKRERLAECGIDTIEALAAVDLTDVHFCTTVTGNDNTNNATRTVAGWKTTAQDYLRRHRLG